MLINVTQAEESRVAIVDNGTLEWIEIEAGGREKLKGNIYKGVVENVNKSLQAAFVKFNSGRPGFHASTAFQSGTASTRCSEKWSRAWKSSTSSPARR